MLRNLNSIRNYKDGVYLYYILSTIKSKLHRNAKDCLYLAIGADCDLPC